MTAAKTSRYTKVAVLLQRGPREVRRVAQLDESAVAQRQEERREVERWEPFTRWGRRLLAAHTEPSEPPGARGGPLSA